jgi:hypothetical protein
MSRLADQLIAGLGVLWLGFGIGCQVAGRYIYVETPAYAAHPTPTWVGRIQAVSWVGFFAFGSAAITLIVRDYRRRTTAESSTKTG